MSDDTAIIELDRYERGAVLTALTTERNQLLEDGRCTDAVDDALIKVAGAKGKIRRGRDGAR